MTAVNRTLDAVSVLPAAGALGISMALASAPAEALPAANPTNVSRPAAGEGVSARLQAIRNGVSAVTEGAEAGGNQNVLKVWWGNGGWGRWLGGWGNGGWGPAFG